MSFMNNLSRIAKSVGDNASNMAKKSGEMIEITKLNMAIQSQEDKIKIAKNEIGATIFSKFEEGQAVDPDIIQYCNTINQVKNDILEIQLKISKLKNVLSCEKCGQEIALDTDFCPNCGEKHVMQEASTPKVVIEFEENKENL